MSIGKGWAGEDMAAAIGVQRTAVVRGRLPRPTVSVVMTFLVIKHAATLIRDAGNNKGLGELDMKMSIEDKKQNMNDTLTLFRPVGPKELALICASGYRAFPPRLPGQPIFYPVLNMNYAVQIARDWNVRDSGAGYVTRFRVRKEFISKYEVQTVGDSTHQELWIPAEELNALNYNIVGEIDIIATFK